MTLSNERCSEIAAYCIRQGITQGRLNLAAATSVITGQQQRRLVIWLALYRANPTLQRSLKQFIKCWRPRLSTRRNEIRDYLRHHGMDVQKHEDKRLQVGVYISVV